MEAANLTALLGFVGAATITPGPNNIMVMASGANFGFRPSLPHLLGISTGVFAIALLGGFGLFAVVDAAPTIEPALRIASAAYLLWIAWKISNSAPGPKHILEARPLSFLQAASFQCANPKIWATGLSSITLFAADHSLASIVLVGLIFSVVGLGSNAIWICIGILLRQSLIGRRRLRVFNIAMAALIIISIYPMLLR